MISVASIRIARMGGFSGKLFTSVGICHRECSFIHALVHYALSEAVCMIVRQGNVMGGGG